ncbi:D-glycero-beta-D-manno-heptose 1,7-bisphosphate 7-phosphatase [Anaerocolumna jejuensis]|uniref:D-glycero-beta-D-manno-heptose 1,7-bisphosphate 7-phosphatase n=1 Tax=Anaerocolumna jejuensis TaxID=259063 RepID=UPI003F7B6690
MASVAKDIPKPMVQICDKPILEHQISTIKRQGFDKIILVIGYMGNVIKDYFKDGHQIGVKITYIEEIEPLGTGGALYYLKNIINEDFLLINGDTIFDVNIERFLEYHKSKNAWVTLLTHPNDHPYDSGIIKTDHDGKVTEWLHKEDSRLYYQNRVNAGLHIISPKIFHMFTVLKKLDLDRDILNAMVRTGKLYAYDTPEYVKDMGTPERYYSVTKDIISKKVFQKNLYNKQKAVFLDRDGTINIYKNFISDPDDFELIDGVAEAIAILNQKGFLVIVVTNQPVIARGECSLDTLQEIHNKMETLLGQKGAYVDGIYFCPHHPDKGFPGERSEYKIDCNCRKPKPGMLLQAAEKYNIDLLNSYMVGDSLIDAEAGKAAGCKSILIKADKSRIEIENIKAYKSLFEFVLDEIRN